MKNLLKHYVRASVVEFLQKKMDLMKNQSIRIDLNRGKELPSHGRFTFSSFFRTFTKALFLPGFSKCVFHFLNENLYLLKG